MSARRIAPGPSGRQLFGVVRRMLADPLPVLDELHATYGDVVELRGPGLRLLLLAHPADIEQVLVGHARATSKGPTLGALRSSMGRNLFTLEGEAHAARRRLLTPIFRPRDIAPHGRWAREHAEATAASWRAGTPVDVSAAMDELVLAAMGRVVLGRPNDDERDRVARLVHDAVELTPRVLDPAYPVKRRLWPRWGRAVDDLVREFDGLCAALVERARSEPPPEGPRDVLHQLLTGHAHGEALLDDDASIREELRGLLLAAHETTSLALAWTLHELARAPLAYDAVLAELDEVVGASDEPVGADHLRQLPRTRAAFDEALRLLGGTFIPRGADHDLPLDHAGITVPGGHELLASMWVVHRDERWWPSPTAYRPERFLGADPDRPRFAYFPFGGGRRTCIGMHLATQSAVIVLAELHRRWRLSPVPGDQPVAPYSNVLVRPTRAIRLVPIAR